MGGTTIGTLVVVAGQALAPTSSGSLPPSVADRPTSLEYCYEEQFALIAGPYLRAVPKVSAKPSRIDAGDHCLEGDLAACHRIPIDPARAWIAGARAGEWICLSDGEASGWAPLKEITLQQAPSRARGDWLGEWERDRGSAALAIRSAGDGKGLEVTGDAEWLAGPDAEAHVGHLGGEGTPAGVVFMLGDPRCVAPDRAEKATLIEGCLECNARLVLVGATLFVTDNRNCGGMNVNFDGIYHRRK